MKTITIQSLAKEVFDNMTIRMRGTGETFVTLKNLSIKWHSELCRDAHDSLLPNDYVYEVIYSALDHIKDIEGLYEDIKESLLCEGYIEAEIYNYDLLNWVSSDLGFAEYCDEVMSDYAKCDSFFDVLSRANYIFKEQIYLSVLDSLEEQLEKANSK